jgi:taurine dioxygenase
MLSPTWWMQMENTSVSMAKMRRFIILMCRGKLVALLYLFINNHVLLRGEYANKITLLCAKIVPSVGGETYYANSTAAYEDLSDEWKARLKGLKGHFTYLKYRPWVPEMDEESKDFNELRQGTIHPLVRTHILTKNKVIFASEGHTDYVVGVSKEESDEILNFLFKHVDDPKYRYVHYWEKGDAVLWDNRSLQHRATEAPPEDRYLVRTTIIDEYQAVEDL